MKKSQKILITLFLSIITLVNSSNALAVNQNNKKVENPPRAKQVYFHNVSTKEYYSDLNTYILTEDKELLGMGNNTGGQLGIKGKTKIEKPIKIISDVESFHKFYGDAFFVIKTNGELWGWGKNSKNEIGNGNNETVWEPVKILDNVAEIHRRNEKMFYAITKDKDLYTWGTTFINNTHIVKNKPVKILEGVNEIGESFEGPEYAMVNDGELWTWGIHTGTGTADYVEKPTKILDNVEKLRLHGYNEEQFYNHELFYAIKKNGELWGWGGGEHNLIGDGNRLYTSKPKKIMDNVVDIYSEFRNQYLVTTNGDLLAWGTNAWGKLGDGSKDPVLKPKKILDNVSKYLDNTGDRFVLKNNGELWGWGEHFYYDPKDPNGPLLPTSKARKIMTDVENIEKNGYPTEFPTSPFVYKNDGELWIWGTHYPNRLATDNLITMTPGKLKDNIDYAGNYSNIAHYFVTKDKELWMWGIYSDNYVIKAVDNVKEVIEVSGLDVITEEGDLWIQAEIPGRTEKIAENVASLEISSLFKEGESGRIYYGYVKENGEVWVATQERGILGFQEGRAEKAVKIFPVK